MAQNIESPLAKNESVAVALLEPPLPEVESIEVALVEVEPTGNESPSHDEIAVLAYSYWEARGCQGGSPEEDWLRAERELGNRGATQKA